MGKDTVMVLFDSFLVLTGLLHHQPADADICDAEHHQHQRQAVVEREGGGDEKDQRHRCGKVLAHEFEPQAEKRIDRPQQRVQRIRSIPLLVP